MLWWSPWWLALYAGVVAGAVARWWLPWSLAAAVGGTVAVGLMAVWALWWRLPRWQTERLQITEPKDRANIEDNFRKTVSQIIGGVAVLIAASIAYYGTLQTLHGSHDLLISQQVSKGFEDLGSDKLFVRFGGIYALEGVMNTSAQYHQPALEAVCAFVRDGTKDYKGDGPPATDIQVALTVIGRRHAGNFGSDLTFTNMSLTVIGKRHAGTVGVDLSGARIPRAYLFGSDLTFTDLSHADLSHADLSHADLTLANLSHADLSHADLSDADLSDADLTHVTLADTILTHADLSRANLTDANGLGRMVQLLNLFLLHLPLDRSADLTGAQLWDAKLTHAYLGRADLNGAYLGGADLSDADLTGANVTQDQLDKACGDTGTKLPPKLTVKPC
jgi:uncharacterized protein YjbI with pentapeptide repeats